MPAAPPPSASRPCAVSPRGALRVYAYTPSQGPPGTTLTAHLRLSLQTSGTVYLRLVLGRTALTTSVRPLPHSPCGDRAWELQAAVPAHAYEAAPGQGQVYLSAEALDAANEVLDSVVFGRFAFLYYAVNSCAIAGLPDGSWDAVLDRSAPSLTRVFMRDPAGHGSSPRIAPYTSPLLRDSTLTQARTRPSLLRTRQASGDDDDDAPCARLELDAACVERMCEEWDDEEVRAGRRLVRFSCAQAGEDDGGGGGGRVLRVSCARLQPGEYTGAEDDAAVISCIYWAATDSCYATSVDIILLLEHVVGAGFDVEEKNRIRRNLEGFRPRTLSRQRADSAAFFAQIMAFPPPKPRTIEKDLKVFHWDVLPRALRKIVSRLPPPLVDTPQSQALPLADAGPLPAAPSLFHPIPSSDSESSLYADASSLSYPSSASSPLVATPSSSSADHDRLPYDAPAKPAYPRSPPYLAGPMAQYGAAAGLAYPSALAPRGFSESYI